MRVRASVFNEEMIIPEFLHVGQSLPPPLSSRWPRPTHTYCAMMEVRCIKSEPINHSPCKTISAKNLSASVKQQVSFKLKPARRDHSERLWKCSPQNIHINHHYKKYMNIKPDPDNRKQWWQIVSNVDFRSPKYRLRASL
jgi:hypothetical protein